MLPPAYPGPIRTDESNAFASHTMRVRIPEILRQTLDANLDMGAPERDAVAALRDEIESGAVMKPLNTGAPDIEDVRDWSAAYDLRAGQTWHGTDWFFAETYTYRRLAEAVDYFESGLDPFLPIKRHEYASPQHQVLFNLALGVNADRDEVLHSLIGMDLWGNRVDLSYAESRTHGMDTAAEDLLVDDRTAILAYLHNHRGEVHVVADNAGSELTLDLVLIEVLLRDDWALRVVLHAKFHPTFVSDATNADVQTFIDGCVRGDYGGAAQSMGLRLQAFIREGRFTIATDIYWNSSQLWWEMPPRLLEPLRASSLVFVKGDANYRRVVGDAFWPHETKFAQIVSGVGIPVACIRTLKSDPVVGLPPGRAEALQAVDPRWRWSGKRGLIQAYLTP